MVYTAVVAVFALLVVVVALASAATRLRMPYPILLVLGGLALGFLPGLPIITLDPGLVLFLFLPPLIYSSAWFTPWRDFRANLRSILLLTIGLVLASTTLVAVIAHAVLGLPWPVAFVLGALISPTDAVAATAIMQRLGVARRVVIIVVRLAWVAVATSILRVLAHFSLITYHWGGWRNAPLMGWAGMRGALSLAGSPSLRGVSSSR